MSDKVILGLDLGQQNDYSVLSIIEIDLPETSASKPTYTVPYIKRFPLKTNYQVIVDEVLETVDCFNLTEKSVIVIDNTGVGRPVVDLFRQKGAKPLAATITGGSKTNWVSKVEANVPKREIVTSLQIVLQSKRLKIAKDLPIINKLIEEFLSFKIKIIDSKSSIQSVMEGAYGVHDDIVMSLGLGIWAAEFFTRRRFFAMGGG